jgi:2-hydroxy-3-keto-5-methylthiopentenyl-1-phosphate phosphatase
MNNRSINPTNTLKNFIACHSKYEKIENFNKNVNSIINRIKNTNRKIAIVSDFDYTLTRRFDLEDEKINFYSSYCIFEHFKHITDEYRIKNKDLFNTYYKYEMDETLEFKKRDELVYKWYKDNLNLIVAEKITKELFKEMVDHSHEKFYFRNGILELFELVLEYKIPFYIISGGLHDVIEHSLRFVLPFYEHLEKNKLLNIISNKFIYDEKTHKMIGYQEPIVYTFNKGEVLINFFKN